MKMCFENLNTFYPEAVTGNYDIPYIHGANAKIDCLIGFNYARTARNPAGTVHFFLDDAQFSGVWTHPDKYIDRLRKFDAVLTPDFSLYTDMPRALQVYNHYRKHWIGAYWEHLGLNVIPTIAWSDERSLEWCFDGEPTGKMVAISAIGTQKSKESKRLFLVGFYKMMEVLNPSSIICYGSAPVEVAKYVHQVPSFTDERGWNNGR